MNQNKYNIRSVTTRQDMKILHSVDKLIKDKYNITNKQISKYRNSLIKQLFTFLEVTYIFKDYIEIEEVDFVFYENKNYSIHKVVIDKNHFNTFTGISDQLNIDKYKYLNQLLLFVLQDKDLHNSTLPNINLLHSHFNTIDYLTKGTFNEFFLNFDIGTIKLHIKIINNEIQNIYDDDNIKKLILMWILKNSSSNLNSIYDIKYLVFIKEYLELQLEFFGLLYLNHNVKTPINQIPQVYNKLISKHRKNIKRMKNEDITDYIEHEINKLMNRDYYNQNLTNENIKYFDKIKIENFKKEFIRIEKLFLS